MSPNETTETADSNIFKSNASSSSIGTVAYAQTNVEHVQNVPLFWLDSSIDENKSACQNTVTQLRRVINKTKLFNDDTRCIKFIKRIDNDQVHMIISGALGQSVLPKVHDMSQLKSIFIFCGNKKYHEQWAKDWPKIKGVYTNIGLICEALTDHLKQGEQNAESVSCVVTDDGASKKALNRLDTTFMYTEILKKIFFTISFNEQDRTGFIEHCRVQFNGNSHELTVIKDLERNYAQKTPIWWYTSNSFLCPMLNAALQTMDGGMMIKIAFFMKDLHRQIEELHAQQRTDYRAKETFTVYRGQGLSKANFEQLKKTKDGLMSFNNFLSTCKNRKVAKMFASDALINPEAVGVIFIMTIDPTQSSIPFAFVKGIGFSKDQDNEVLFSMHSVFRINDIQQKDEQSRLFEVTLTLTNDSDEDLRRLTTRLEENTYPEEAGWFRVGCILLQMGQPKVAEELFKDQLIRPCAESRKGIIYRFLELSKAAQGQYQEALQLYDESMAICKKILPGNHPDLAESYNNLGNVYHSMGDYLKALSSHEKALATQQESLPPNHPDIAASFDNIGAVYESKGDRQKAQSNYERAVTIGERSLPRHHPVLQKRKENLDRIKKRYNRFFCIFIKKLIGNGSRTRLEKLRLQTFVTSRLHSRQIDDATSPTESIIVEVKHPIGCSSFIYFLCRPWMMKDILPFLFSTV